MQKITGRKNYFEKIANTKTQLYIRLSEKMIPIENDKCCCKICGSPLLVLKHFDNYYLRPCTNCIKLDNRVVLEKFISIAGEQKGKEIFESISKNKTRNWPSRITKYLSLGYSEEEAKNLAKQSNIKKLKNAQNSQNHVKYCPEKRTNNIQYWLVRGYSEEEARKKVSERQKTFSLKKCIEKYGETEGLKRWEERQRKWRKTLNEKPLEEKLLIAKKRTTGLGSYNGFSNISQKMFNQIYEQIKEKVGLVYYATSKCPGLLTYGYSNKEFMVFDEYYDRYYSLDFFIPELNIDIEFDGAYYHKLTKDKDEFRDKRLKDYGIQVLRIKEEEYKEDEQKIVDLCVKWIYHLLNKDKHDL